MRRPPPPDPMRCVARARWSGAGKDRCRKVAHGPDRLCTMHERFPPRPPSERSALVASLASADLGAGKEIRVEVRERDDVEFVSVRLYVAGAPTRRSFYLSPGQAGELHAALDLALDRLDGVTT